MAQQNNEGLIVQYYELAEEAFKKKKYRGALSYYDLILQKEPERWDALFLKAKMSYYDMNASISAVEWATTALLKDISLKRYFDEEGFTLSHITKKLNSFACSKIMNRQYEGALEDLSNALQFDSTYGMAMLTMAECYLAIFEFNKAMDWLEKAVVHHPEMGKEIDGYDCYQPLRPFVRYQKLVGIDRTVPENAKQKLSAAITDYRKANFQEAYNRIMEALQLEPNWPEALLYRGILTYEMAKPADYDKNRMIQSGALNDILHALDYDKSLLQSPELDALRSILAPAINDRVCDDYLPVRRLYEAIHDIKLAIEVQPSNVWPILTMAEIYVIMEDFDQAIKWLEKAVETDESICKLLDSYECYAPLRKVKRYCKLIGIGTIEKEYPNSKKGFYMLEMFVEPGGMRESFKFLSGDKDKINQVVLSRLKAPSGLYALLVYGITIRVHSYCEGRLQNTVNILPHIKVELPHMKPINGNLSAEYQKDNLFLMKNEAGELVPKERLARYLSNYEFQPW
ncbi:MAG TPA: hypothetical protein VHQ24_07785 [Lachnospiraceae bacterium]|nr:hypothetical protein [Lachnospiraceae bacterium]